MDLIKRRVVSDLFSVLQVTVSVLKTLRLMSHLDPPSLQEVF